MALTHSNKQSSEEYSVLPADPPRRPSSLGTLSLPDKRTTQTQRETEKASEEASVDCAGSAESAMLSSNQEPPQFSLIYPLLETLQITKVNIKRDESDYDYYGAMSSDTMIYEAAAFISNNSDAQAPPDVENILRDFIRTTSKDCQTNCGIEPVAAWFTVRMFKPNNGYVIPRWHRDGRMTDCTSKEHELHCKYATVLLGAPTLVLPETKAVSAITHGDAPINLCSQRTEVVEALSSEVPLRIAEGQIIRFSWGRNDSPMHSEPNITMDRIFVSVLYGSESEIRDMVEVMRHRGSMVMYRED